MVFGRKSSGNGSVRALKRKIRDLEGQLNAERSRRDSLIDQGIQDAEETLRVQFRKDLGEVLGSMIESHQEFLNVINGLSTDLTESERQLELARGTYKSNLQEVRGIAREGLQVFENLLLGSDALKKIPAIFVGSENKIVYGTPGFFAKFPLSREEVYRGDVSNLFSHVGSEYSEAVRNYARDNFPGNLELSFVVEGMSRSVEIVPTHVDSKWFNGTWLEFRDSGGFFKYISGIFKKKPSK